MELKIMTAIEVTQPAQKVALFRRDFGSSYENKELGSTVEEVVQEVVEEVVEVVRELRARGRS